MKESVKSYLFLGGVAGTIVLIDQVSKTLVRTYIPVNDYWPHEGWFVPFARLFHAQNTGVAFGMLQGANLVFATLAVIVSIAIIYYYPRVTRDDWTLRIALSMQLAGALGNLIDRIVFGQVTDFISVGNFAVFNVADASISVGVAILILGVWLQERKKPKNEGVPVVDPLPADDETTTRSGEVNQ